MSTTKIAIKRHQKLDGISSKRNWTFQYLNGPKITIVYYPKSGIWSGKYQRADFFASSAADSRKDVIMNLRSEVMRKIDPSINAVIGRFNGALSRGFHET